MSITKVDTAFVFNLDTRVQSLMRLENVFLSRQKAIQSRVLVAKTAPQLPKAIPAIAPLESSLVFSDILIAYGKLFTVDGALIPTFTMIIL